MKKLLLLSLIAILASFGLSGCSDSKDEKVVFVPPANYSEIYDIEFFGTSQTDAVCTGDPAACEDASFLVDYASVFFITNACQFAIDNQELIGVKINDNGTNMCSTEEGGDAPFEGQFSITNSENKVLKTITKAQLTNDLIASMAPADQYQYTEYNNIPYSLFGPLTGTGLSGYTYDAVNKQPSATSVANNNAVYTISALPDGKVMIKTRLPNKIIYNEDGAQVSVTAHVVMIGTKSADQTKKLENKVTAEFLLNPAPAPAQ